MIITLKGADFSKNNIGPLSSWLISREIGNGARYSGPTYVSKGGAFSATVVLAEGYTLDSAGVTVIMGGTAVTSGVTVNGNTITINIASVTGNVKITVPTIDVEDGGNEDEYNSADMWLSQTISSVGAVSTTGITQSNIMAKSRFVGSATFESLGESFQMALVTYNDDGSFKARGSWTSLTKDSPVTYTDENPFNVVIATKTTNTSYSVAEMVAMLNIVGTSEDSLWDGTIYSDSTSYWIRQSMDGSGNIISTDHLTYNRSNLMAASNFNESIKITAKSVKLMTAIITYDTSGKFISRSTWSTVEIGQSVTYTDANPFNVIIASHAESNYSLEEMLALIDVRSAE